MNVPKTVMRQPKATKQILCQVEYTCSLPGLSISFRRMTPGKRKIKDAAKPPVRLMMYEMTGTKRARSREMKNHTMLSTSSRKYSLMFQFFLGACSVLGVGEPE